ncbi:ImmA/IrrE family metallo-endopeptidase [Staphylococcus pettenkoferi]|mgnify:CR=1 FL=1|uniref:ImmA/IrrE family metallo-endopeptidase n=1 Tax=Staphylococcus pettenkoferi TaxID=170573 RepID=A0ABT4BHL0_9STAP|nr:ImmA/IrrE family metallo-endopeptidase [Staphylococcus pettenkoferi]MCI2804448.1 ImmA/IrrE family metallo-endopeptidase [Staphylococcus pettenkoferi]MCY1563586.1 ImmA/IrrE family metallo-endopeptidase [Staphylococcus pettenkoferi]MCY1571059.1 ImmA/IrrE family metallo-endopeptidase [Staphylococcus pettenkoferi]MCY1582158.1 ImmA/IrrE family metallo-endopeptidase [Staphylococcus pettenkoferi]MCY1606418.1 ImmA/IrrE family metallo-endopeptidase [Staphylococcus pettenkoferi]
MSVEIQVKPEVLRWAINASDKSKVDLEKDIKDIDYCLENDSQFTLSQLEKLSKKLNIPWGYLMLDSPPHEEVELMKYRTIDNLEHSRPSRELIEIIDDMQKKQEFMKETMIEDGFSPLSYVGSITHETATVEAANKIKEVLDLDTEWNINNRAALRTLKQHASNAGILIMQNGIVKNNTHRKLNIEEFRAFVICDEYVPLIFINSNDSEKGKLFSLCHELVHIWLGNNELYNVVSARGNNQTQEEQFCNEIAAEILLPESILRQAHAEQEEGLKDFIINIATTYSVSELVVSIRMKNLKLIKYRTFEELYSYFSDKMIENIKKKNEIKGHPSYYNVQLSRMDNRFLNTVKTKAEEGKLLYTEAYDLTGVNGKTYSKLMEELGGKND